MTAIGSGLAFLHVPKTGGTWAVRAMEAAGVSLADIGMHADRNDLPLHGEFFCFAFVREPLSWYRSWWCHRHTFCDWQDGQPLDQVGRAPFEQFVSDALGRFPGYVSDLFEQFTGPVGAEIDFVGRYESLVDDLIEALRRGNQTFTESVIRSYPATNVSSRILDTHCRRDIIDRLKETEHRAYERFYETELTA